MGAIRISDHATFSTAPTFDKFFLGYTGTGTGMAEIYMTGGTLNAGPHDYALVVGCDSKGVLTLTGSSLLDSGTVPIAAIFWGLLIGPSAAMVSGSGSPA